LKSGLDWILFHTFIPSEIMKKNNKQLQGLVHLLPQLSKHQGWEEQLDMHSLFGRWSELLDRHTALHCKPLKIINKVLWVEVENSAWLQQLQFQTVPILEILNNALSISRIEGLRFCVADQEEAAKVETGPVLCYVPPPAEDLAAFERQVESISDEEVREALIRFWYLSQACKKKDNIK
jgi:Dna[CI] antecedent, DciA